jgi:hypothetical protein
MARPLSLRALTLRSWRMVRPQSDATVRHILVLTGLPNGLTEAAKSAARRIKFIPAAHYGPPGLDVYSTRIQFQSLLN